MPRILTNKRWLALAGIPVGIVILMACQQRNGPPVSQPAATRPVPARDTPAGDSNSAASPSADAPVAAKPEKPLPAVPKRPEPNWTLFREAIDEKQDAVCNVAWLGENRFQVDTSNIQRLTVDFTKLPPGSPEKGPWLVNIDGQTIEFTGFKPRAGYTGLKRDLVRSKNGVWDIDRKRLYRAGE